MATIIEIRTTDPSTEVRSFPWPVLQRGDPSFPDGVFSTEIEASSNRRSIRLTHQLAGVPLIERLINQNKACFACTVASPISAYRLLHRSNHSSYQVQWDVKDLGAPPLFLPFVVVTDSIECVLDSARDGVAELWDGSTICLPKGAKLIVAPAFQLQSALLQLLTFKLDPDLLDGQLIVKPSEESGFRFNVHMAEDLFRFLEFKRDPTTRRNIMTHIVSAALSHLHHRYAKDDGTEGWKSFGNLRALAEYLEANSLPIWVDDEFNPEYVATTLGPHLLPQRDEDDE